MSKSIKEVKIHLDMNKNIHIEYSEKQTIEPLKEATLGFLEFYPGRCLRVEMELEASASLLMKQTIREMLTCSMSMHVVGVVRTTPNRRGRATLLVSND